MTYIRPYENRSASKSAEELNARKRRRVIPSSRFCAPCQSLKFDRSFRRALHFYESARNGTNPRPTALRNESHGSLYYEDCFLVHRFKDRLTFETDCSLCSFFRCMWVQPGVRQHYKLLAFCGSDSSNFCLPRLKDSEAWDQVNHAIFLAVVPDIPAIPPNGHGEFWLEKDIPAVGSIMRLRPGESDDHAIIAARELNEKVNFDVVQEWLSFCAKHHDKACKASSDEPVSQGFRVINCFRNPPVVEEHAWGITYAALSYVWGKSVEDQKKWPKTVLDAVAITKELGLQYLWVDRLCIDQESLDEKLYLIGRMITLYSQAELTIVAAAGFGAGHGIPGIDKTPRKSQPQVEFDDGTKLISTHRDPRIDVLEAEWFKRGWTYQEGILSNRRLVFTEHQVYWECRCMATHESIRLPLDLCHEPSKLRMRNFMMSGVFQGDGDESLNDNDDIAINGDTYRPRYGFPVIGAQSLQSELRALEEHIRAFSARDLSFDGDSLEAFKGILGLYQHVPNVSQFQGLHIWTGKLAGRRPGAQFSLALSVSTWHHRTRSNFQMFVSQSCSRRTHLPSWAWAGWKGTVSWRMPPADEHATILCNLIVVDALDFLWAADIKLQDLNNSIGLALNQADSHHTSWSPDMKILEIRHAYTLKYFARRPTKKTWGWIRLAGRQGREKCNGGNMEWDLHWYRLARRLVCISVSVPMTAAEWTAKHYAKELVSVLMFVGRDPSISHGRARFVTLRKVEAQNGRELWERIGIVQLTLAAPELARYRTIGDLLQQIPVQPEGRSFFIQ